MFGNGRLLDRGNAIAVVDQIAAADLKARPKWFSFEIRKVGWVLKAGCAGLAMGVQENLLSRLCPYIAQSH